jgi:hypothetical protein
MAPCEKKFFQIYCLYVHSFFLVSFTSMYTTLKIISGKFLGVSLIWTFFSHACLRYLCLFVGELMSCLRYLCLFAYSGVQHTICCVFRCQFLWYSLTFIYKTWALLQTNTNNINKTWTLLQTNTNNINKTWTLLQTNTNNVNKTWALLQTNTNNVNKTWTSCLVYVICVCL